VRKRSKGRGKPQGAITRRDPEAKRRRREEREQERLNAGEQDGATDPDDAERESDPGRDGEQDGTAPRTAAARASAEATDGEESSSAGGHGLEGAEWGKPFARLEEKWTWLETRLLFGTLMALVALLCLWVAIHGMYDRSSVGGLAWRAVVGIAVFGTIARVITRKLAWPEWRRTIVTIAALAVGVFTAKLWRHVGNDYFQGVLDWLQQGSSIALFGGLKGINTRLTMLVALIGASLACGGGTHINVDIIVRFVPKALRKYAHIVAMVGASAVCAASSYGFFDHSAITAYKASATDTFGAKLGKVAHGLGDDFFVLRKQLRLDLGAFPYVIQGKRWNADERMSGRQWNEFIDEGGFAEQYGRDKIDGVKAAPTELDRPRRPFVVTPEGSAAGTLLEALNLVFPFGFLMLTLRLLLRALLVVAGFVEPHLEGEGSGDQDQAAPAGEQEAR
jgi:TRAP-type C4-dicarboxylate transport system permease small subunit